MASRIILAASVALRRSDRLLLVERGHAPARGLYAFPGGRAEPGESMEEAARRELFEETGLTAGVLELWRVMDLPGDDEGNGPVFRLHVFAGAMDDGEPVAQDDAASAGWYALDDMQGLPMTHSTLQAAREILGE